MVNGWKVSTIILLISLILETSLFFWAINLGTESIEKENECIVNVCGFNSYGKSEKYDAFSFDEVESICYCFKDRKIEKEEYIR